MLRSPVRVSLPFAGESRVSEAMSDGPHSRHGYIFEWCVGDHPPRHVHVEKENGELIGRLDLERMTGMEGWQPDRKLLKIIEELRREGRL